MIQKRKKIIIISTLIIITIIAGWIIVHYITRSRPFMYAGTLESQRVIVTARIPSDIINIFISEGDNVTKNQALLELSCDSQKILARQLDNDFDRANALMQRGHVSRAEMDIITRNKQDNDLHLGWCNIASPIDGVITTKFRQVGEIVSPGTPLFTITDPYDIHAYFYVPYDMLAKLHIGDHIIGILPELPDVTFNGRITKINEVAEFTPKNVQTRDERMRLVYGIKVQFENPEQILKSGMTIESALINENKYSNQHK